MSVYSELTQTIETMESDLRAAREVSTSDRKYLNDYEQGFADGVVETMEATLKFIKQVHSNLSWEEPPNSVRGDMENEFGDVPPTRQEMGG